MEEEENVFREDSFLIGHAIPCVFVFSLFWLVVVQEQTRVDAFQNRRRPTGDVDQ